MIIGGSWNPGVFNDQFSSTEDWETAELPFPDDGQQGRIQQGVGDRYTVSAESQNKEAAWEFMKWLYSVPIMTEMYEKGMGVMGVTAANTGESDVRGVALLAPTENDMIIPPEPELPTQTPDITTVMQMIFDDRGPWIRPWPISTPDTTLPSRRQWPMAASWPKTTSCRTGIG